VGRPSTAWLPQPARFEKPWLRPAQEPRCAPDAGSGAPLTAIDCPIGNRILSGFRPWPLRFTTGGSLRLDQVRGAAKALAA